MGQQIFTVGCVVHIVRFAKVHQRFPLRIAAVHHIFIQHAGGFQNVHAIDDLRVGNALPLGQGFAVGALTQVVVTPVLAVQIHLNDLSRLIIQPQSLGKLLQGGVAQAGGFEIRVGISQQDSGIAVVIPILKEGIIKGIAAIGFARIYGQGFLLAGAHGFACDFEGAHLADAHLADAQLAVFIKVFKLAGILQILHVIGRASSALDHHACAVVKQIGVIRI